MTQRGNARQDVFITDPLRTIYLELLREHASLNHLWIVAYCLMTNHLHLVVIPETEKSMENTFRHAHSRFAQYWNTEFHTDGHLWQNRYYSCPVEESAVGRVICYVENNPVRARMVARGEQFPWSSAGAHVEGEDRSGCLDLQWWRSSGWSDDWRSILENAVTNDHGKEIRRATFTGRPLGSEAFIAELERRLNRKLAARAGGRPRNVVNMENPSQLGLWSAG